jgi:hypothetical protein
MPYRLQLLIIAGIITFGFFLTGMGLFVFVKYLF